MLSWKVRVDDNVTSRSAAVQNGIARGVHRKVMAKGAAEVVKDNFRSLDRSRHRGGSFHFYGRAAQATSYGVQGNSAYVSIDQEGIALRRFGGTTRPTGGRKFQTVPNKDNPQAQGKRAPEFSNLHFRRNADGQSGRLCDPTGRVYFWMVKSTTHKPDPSVLPKDSEITDAATTAIGEWVELMEDRNG